MLVYLAGPYRADDRELVCWNVKAASDMAAILLAEGFEVCCPHSMTHGYERYEFLTDDDFLRNGIELLRRCDAVLLLDGWEQSAGTLAEKDFAEANRIPVFKTVEALREYARQEAEE